jgi:hypothetical protein
MSAGLTPPSSLLRAHASVLPPPRASVVPADTQSGQVAVSPCWAKDLPDVVSAPLSLRAWTPTPAARVVHGPVSSHPTAACPPCGPGRRATMSVQRLQDGALCEAAVMRAGAGPQVGSPPRSLLPLRPTPHGSRGFYVRAARGSFPPHAPDMLAVRIGPLTAEDFHLIRCAALSAAPRTLGIRRGGSWVGTRRVTLLHVSSSPRLAPCVRLSPHTAQHLGSISIAKAMKHLFPLRWHPQKFIRVSSHVANMPEHNARAQLARSLGTWFATYLCTPYCQRLGAFAMGSMPRVDGVTVRRLLGPIRLFVRALACRWGLPCLRPTRLDSPHEVSRVRCRRLKRNGLGGVLLAAPSALCGSPGCLQGRTG